MDDSLDYQFMIQEALRDVVRQALQHVQEQGLPGEHHFYIAFRTDDPEVLIGEDLKAQYPEEMTIVVQHQYRNLEVDQDGFSIGLSFGGKPRSLAIPFRAVTSFTDPSVHFGLRFQYEPPVDIGSTDEEPAAEPAARNPEGGKVVSFDAARKSR